MTSMKKLLLTLTTIFAVLAMGIIANAQTVTNKDVGMTFTVPDSYHVEFSNSEVSNDVSIAVKQGRVGINIMAIASTDAYFEGLIPEENLRKLLEDMMSTERLSEMLQHGNAKFTKKDVYSTNINGVKYFVFDGTYVSSGEGVYTEALYITAYSWYKNGKIYYMEYYRFQNEADTFRPEDFLRNVNYDIGEIKIVINGRKIYSDTAPAAVNGRVIVPIRAVAEAMNYEVLWDAENQLIGLKPLNGSGNTVIFGINYSDYLVNGETYYLDVPAIAVNGRTYIPLRAAAESIGGTVTWDPTSNTAYING